MFKRYIQALANGEIIEVVPLQLATAAMLNGNLKACFDNDEALKLLLDQSVESLIGQIAGAVNLIQGGVTVDGDSLKKLNDKITVINTLLTSTDINLDTMQELVNFIKGNEAYITGLSLSKISYTDVVDNLSSTNVGVPLSANQGRILQELVASCYTISQITGLLIGKSDTNHSHGLAQAIPAMAGFMSAMDKQKLDGVADNANNYQHPATHPASIIEQDPFSMFVSALQIAKWDDTYSKSQTDSLVSLASDMLKGGVSIAYDNLRKVEITLNQITTLLTSNDVNLNTVQEIINAIKSEQTLIDGLMTSKVSIADIVDDLITAVANKPLSAYQGTILKGLVDQKANSADVYTQTQINTALANKVSVVVGKGLSTNDFDNAYKSKVDSINVENGASVVTLASQALVNKQQYIVGADGLTLTLPASPTTGMSVELLDGTHINTNTIIAGNGSNVNGLASYTIDTPQYWVRIVYVNATYGWKIFGF